MKLSGGDVHLMRLTKAGGPELARRVSQALYVGGDAVRVEAQTSITEGAVSGKHHVPSKPGEPPNADTHHLSDRIETTQPEPLTVHVTSNADYGGYLERGTSKMAARPYMAPALAKKRGEVVENVQKAARSLIKE